MSNQQAEKSKIIISSYDGSSKSGPTVVMPFGETLNASYHVEEAEPEPAKPRHQSRLKKFFCKDREKNQLCCRKCKEGENCFAYYYSYPHRVSNRFFYRFGKFVGTYPRKVIIGMLLLSIVPLIGFAFIMDVIKTESEEIFDARSTKYREYIDFVAKKFEFNQFSLPNENPKQSNSFEVMVDLDSNRESIQDACNKVNNLVMMEKKLPVTYENVCLRNFTTGQCLQPQECFQSYQELRQKGRYVYPMWSVDFTNNLSNAWLDFITYNIGYSNFNYDIYYQAVTKISAREGLLFGFTVVIMTSFSVIVSSQINCVQSRSMLALAGVFSTILGESVGIGICMFAKIPLTPITLVSPFVLIGVGIDTTFVLMAVWAKQERDHSVAKRMALTFEHSYGAILVSCLTAVTAFVVGMFTPFPATNYTCAYLTSSAVFVCLYNSTFFASVLALHNENVLKNRHSVCCCYKVPKHKARKAFCGHQLTQHDEEEDFSVLELGPRLLLPKLVLNRYARVIILIAVGVLAACSVYLISDLEIQLKRDKLVNKDSPFNLYLQKKKDSARDNILHFLIKSPYNNEIYRKGIDNFLSGIYGNEKLGMKMREQSMRLFWLTQADMIFTYQLNRSFTLSKDDVMMFKLLERQIRGVTTLYTEDNVFYSRFYAFPEPIDAGETIRTEKFLDELRAICVKAVTSPDFEIKFHNIAIIDWDRNIVIKHAIFTSLVIGLGIALLWVYLMLPDIQMFLLVAIITGTCVANTIGFMVAFGLHLNFVTYVEILLSIGFCVDFMTHSAHGYLTAQGNTTEETAANSLETIGMPLFNAALSSVLGVCLLAAAETYAMRSFFTTMTILMCLSFFYGVIALPVMFSILGSRWHPMNWAMEERTFDWGSIFKTKLVPRNQFSHNMNDNASFFKHGASTHSKHSSSRPVVSSGGDSDTVSKKSKTETIPEEKEKKNDRELSSSEDSEMFLSGSNVASQNDVSMQRNS